MGWRKKRNAARRKTGRKSTECRALGAEVVRTRCLEPKSRGKKNSASHGGGKVTRRSETRSLAEIYAGVAGEAAGRGGRTGEARHARIVRGEERTRKVPEQRGRVRGSAGARAALRVQR